MPVLDPANEYARSRQGARARRRLFQQSEEPRRRNDEGGTQRVYDEYRRSLWHVRHAGKEHQ